MVATRYTIDKTCQPRDEESVSRNELGCDRKCTLLATSTRTLQRPSSSARILECMQRSRASQPGASQHRLVASHTDHIV